MDGGAWLDYSPWDHKESDTTKRLHFLSFLDRKEIKAVNPKEISLEYSLEGLMLKLKLQYFGHLMQTDDSLEKPLILGKMKAGGEGDNRGRDGWMASPTQWT